VRVGPSHLTYCTNIHAGESWAEVREALELHTIEVKRRVCPDDPFGVGLRLSARAAAELLQGDALPQLAAWLRAHGLYVFTLNGFPYGPFHGTPVKEAVYRPDWSEPERGTYTDQLETILAALLPAGVDGTVSTVPGCFAPRGTAAALEAIADNLVDRAVALWRRREAGGPCITLCLEPEPCCVLETVAQTIAFFERLFAAPARSRFRKAARCSESEAEAALRRHLGVCLDTCHAAVEFEDPRGSVDTLLGAGIVIGKVQVTTGLHIDDIDRAASSLRSFADPVYLHQVVVSSESGLHRFVDLPPALDAHARGEVEPGPWRVHFHVPVFLADLDRFTNTQAFVEDALHEIVRREASRHFEVETYTWDVLPPPHRDVPVAVAIARELEWTLSKVAP
jgi:sugar phosphate isomerase/epimerase